MQEAQTFKGKNRSLLSFCKYEQDKHKNIKESQLVVQAQT